MECQSLLIWVVGGEVLFVFFGNPFGRAVVDGRALYPTCCRAGGGVWVLRSWPYWPHRVTYTHGPPSSPCHLPFFLLALTQFLTTSAVALTVRPAFPPAFSESQPTNSQATAGLNFCLCPRIVSASRACGSRFSRLLRSSSLWVTREKPLRVEHAASVELVNISAADSTWSTSRPRLQERDCELAWRFQEVLVKMKSRRVLSACKLHTNLKSKFIIKNFTNLALVHCGVLAKFSYHISCESGSHAKSRCSPEPGGGFVLTAICCS